MENRKRLAALLLCLALLLALSGCGSVSDMARAAKKMEKLQSYRMDMNMDMALKLSVLGQAMDMDMDMSGSSDVNVDPARTRTSMRIKMLGEEMTVLSYTEKTDAGVVSYSSADGGASWSKKTVNSGELAKTDSRKSFSALLKIAEGFEKAGTETVRGSEATVYAGVIRGEDVERVMAMSEAMENVFAAMDMSMDRLQPEDYGSVPVTIAIDSKSGLVVRYTMDLTEFMARLMPKMIDAVLSEAAAQAGLDGLDLSALGFTAETGRVFATVELYDFDAVGGIEIPPEALEAPEAAA